MTGNALTVIALAVIIYCIPIRAWDMRVAILAGIKDVSFSSWIVGPILTQGADLLHPRSRMDPPNTLRPIPTVHIC